MPKTASADEKDQVIQKVLDGLDAVKAYWFAPVGSIDETKARQNLGKVISDTIDMMEAKQ